jgi:hypothetical protein
MKPSRRATSRSARFSSAGAAGRARWRRRAGRSRWRSRPCSPSTAGCGRRCPRTAIRPSRVSLSPRTTRPTRRWCHAWGAASSSNGGSSSCAGRATWPAASSSSTWGRNTSASTRGSAAAAPSARWPPGLPGGGGDEARAGVEGAHARCSSSSTSSSSGQDAADGERQVDQGLELELAPVAVEGVHAGASVAREEPWAPGSAVRREGSKEDEDTRPYSRRSRGQPCYPHSMERPAGGRGPLGSVAGGWSAPPTYFLPPFFGFLPSGGPCSPWSLSFCALKLKGSSSPGRTTVGGSTSVA